MKGDHMATDPANPSPRELPLSNQTRFKTKTLALALCAFTSLTATGLSAGTAHAQTADTGGILFQVQAGVSSPTSVLIGHWRATSIVFDSPRDEHLVLYPDGTAKYWVVTAS